LVFILIAPTIQAIDAKKPSPSPSDDAKWWNRSWSCRRLVTLTESSGLALTDYPVEVTFAHSGKAQADGDDIRVIMNGAEVPSAVSSVDNQYATVVFEVDMAAGASAKAYIYYNNPLAASPGYDLTPLQITVGNDGNAVIDDSVYIGWAAVPWGWGSANVVELWVDFRVDFDNDGSPLDDPDLITDVSGRIGGIGRHRIDTTSIGLGDYVGYVQTPVYVDINFADASLRVYRNQDWVKTTQADVLTMFSQSYDYASYSGGPDENIVDMVNAEHQGFNWMYNSLVNPGWFAFRMSASGAVFSVIPIGIGTEYLHHFAAKEMNDWDRVLYLDMINPEVPRALLPYDQPTTAQIYYYLDDSNDYSGVDQAAQVLNATPLQTVGAEEIKKGK